METRQWSSEVAGSPDRAAEIIDGNAIAAAVRAQVVAVVGFAREKGRAPGLAMILKGDDPHVGDLSLDEDQSVRRGCNREFHQVPPTDTQRCDALELINSLNGDDRVNGIPCQLPMLLRKEIGVQLEGRHALEPDVRLSGKPVDQLLREANAAVTQRHRQMRGRHRGGGQRSEYAGGRAMANRRSR